MDDYICPTCETECICSRPKLPILKIKLTVPPTMQQETVLTRPPVPQSKRKRGRPPKAAITGAATPYTLTQNQPKRRPGRPRKNPLPVPSPSTVTSPPARKLQPGSSVISDFDGDGFPTFISASVLYASNSSASEAGMSSDSADDIDDDVDSEIEKEEEKLIRKEERERGKRDKKVERARVKRQQQQHKSSRKDSGRQYQQQQARRESNTGRHDLFHSDDGGSNPHSEWIIKTRRPSDADLKMVTMDVDTSSSSAASSSSSEDEESDDEDDGDDADEEPDATVEVEDEDDEGHRYTGLATGWSDSEESSFDADLFFANLSDSHSSQGDSGSDREDIGCEHGCPDHLSPPMDSGSQMELEVTGDGQLVFTTGNSNFGFSSSLLDFEVHHQPYNDSPEATTPPPSQTQSAAAECEDIEMQTSSLVEEDKHATSDDGEEEYNGNTTDEDLVGPDQLPNAKALRIFRLPDCHPPSLDSPFHFAFNGLSGVNPLSTVSPAGSPVPSRTPGRRRKSSLLRNTISPSPSDILSGNFRRLDVYGEEDEDLSMDSSSETTRGRKRVKATGSAGPVTRPFSLPDIGTPNNEVFVVDDERKVAPSPYHKKTLRLRNRRLLFGGILKHKSGVSHDGTSTLFRKEELSSYQPARHSSMPPSTRAFSLDQDLVSSVGSLPELEPSSAAPTSDGADLAETPPMQMVKQIALDDVLDSSFMGEDDAWSDQSACTNDESTLSHFRRWDLISIGAFRKTRENALSSDGGGWGSDAGEKTNDYESFLRGSPMNIMLSSNRLGNNSTEKLWRSKLSVSPVLSPSRDDEGEKTPTSFSLSPPAFVTKSPGRRQEHKSRRKHTLYHQHPSPSNKNGGGSLHPYHQHHTHHHHHPNSKTRSVSSSQRFGFFSPGSMSPTSQ